MSEDAPMPQLGTLADFQDGDVLTINGLYADGSQERNETPPAEYANKPLQRWRCRLPQDHNGIGAMQIDPILENGEPDLDYGRRRAAWIRSTPHWATGASPNHE